MSTETPKARKKVEIVKIKNESNLLVTFSKRRVGLMKKANELSTLTGAEVGVTIFSPSKKAYSFGCPDIESVLGRFKNPTPQNLTQKDNMSQVHRENHLEPLYAHLNLLKEEVKKAKKYGEQLDQMNLGESGEPNWWEANVEELSLEQLEALKVKMEDLKNRVLNNFNEMMNEEMQRDPFIQSENPFNNGSSIPLSILANVLSSPFAPSDDFRAQENVDMFSQYSAAGPSAFVGNFSESCEGHDGGDQSSLGASSSGGGVPRTPGGSGSME